MAQAIQIERLASGILDRSGRPLSGGYVKFFESDGTTLKSVYADSEKLATKTLNANNGVDLDDRGMAEVFADGVYVIKSYTISGVLVDSWSSHQYNPNDPSTASFIDASLYGSANNSERISLAISDAAGSDKTVYLPPANYDIDTNLTVPSNINLRFEMGAYLTVAAGITFTMNGSIDAPLYNIFRGSGTVTIENKNNDLPSIWLQGGAHDNRTFDGIVTIVDGVVINGNGSTLPLHIQKTEDGVSTELMRFDRKSASPADNDYYDIKFYSKNDNDEQVGFVIFRFMQLDVSDGTEKGQFSILVADGADGSLDEVFKFNISEADLVSLKIGGTEVISSSRIAEFVSLKIGSTEVIDSARIADFVSLKVGGTEVIDSTRNIKSEGLTINKFLNYKVVSKTANYTASDETVILVDASSGSVTINLPASSGLLGRKYIIVKIDSSSNTVIIDGNASETINGSVTKNINGQYGLIEIISDNTNWTSLSYDSRWISWTPTYTASGSMTWTSITTEHARYKIVNDVVFFEIFVHGTTGGTQSNELRFTLPVNPENDGVAWAGRGFDSSSTAIREASGAWISGSSYVQVNQADNNNWSLGSYTGFSINGFYKI